MPVREYESCPILHPIEPASSLGKINLAVRSNRAPATLSVMGDADERTHLRFLRTDGGGEILDRDRGGQKDDEDPSDTVHSDTLLRIAGPMPAPIPTLDFDPFREYSIFTPQRPAGHKKNRPFGRSGRFVCSPG